MAAPNINHAGYDRRLAVIQTILDRLGLTATSITPVEYVEHSPFPYNNFLYKLDLAAPAIAANFTPKPCTTLPPAEGISTLILKLSNPKAEGLDNTNRVENDVIASSLIRDSLSQRAPDMADIVPAVYAWEPFMDPSPDADEASSGWTLMGYRPGSNLDGHFATLDEHDKVAVMEQVATILSAIQAVQLPAGVTGLGGMTLTSDGAIVTGQRSILPGGPWPSYANMLASKLQFQLGGDAEHSAVLRGWRDNGALRAKLDDFISSPAIAKVLARGRVDANHRVLTHGDFTMNNMLYDPATGRISALLDFDWAAVAHPAHEFFSGLHDLQGGTHPGDAALQSAVLTGDFNTTTAAADDNKEVSTTPAWAQARTWDAALRKAGGLRPSSLAGITTLESLRELEDLVAPFALCHSVMLSRTPADKTQALKAETEAKLDALLDSLILQAGI
ncbi:hypothetical protein J7T55_009969 [Diaporthe amygdali]|uniref:uncharacterized protein n=1 Tax=Phomopsis amygdali TaxID=1214568 RepID=UPI0022FEF1DC|nr:uncharacterized protein J7T55_009969 [Diaporthe amygdali]KAJ0116818.1 hypothetical protein J7T55_009969 [Diaporthe amygdali]